MDGQAVLRCDNSVNIIIITDGNPTADDERNQNIIDLYPIVVGDDEGIIKQKYMRVATYQLLLNI